MPRAQVSDRVVARLITHHGTLYHLHAGVGHRVGQHRQVGIRLRIIEASRVGGRHQEGVAATHQPEVPVHHPVHRGSVGQHARLQHPVRSQVAENGQPGQQLLRASRHHRRVDVDGHQLTPVFDDRQAGALSEVGHRPTHRLAEPPVGCRRLQELGDPADGQQRRVGSQRLGLRSEFPGPGGPVGVLGLEAGQEGRGQQGQGEEEAPAHGAPWYEATRRSAGRPGWRIGRRPGAVPAARHHWSTA